MNKPIIKILNYYETHEAEGGTEQIAWEIEQVHNEKTDNKTIEKELENLFESMEHFITSYDEMRFNKYVNKKLKQKDDYYKGIIKEMIGRKKEATGRVPKQVIDEEDGYNLKRTEILEILSKHKIDI